MKKARSREPISGVTSGKVNIVYMSKSYSGPALISFATIYNAIPAIAAAIPHERADVVPTINPPANTTGRNSAANAPPTTTVVTPIATLVSNERVSSS